MSKATEAYGKIDNTLCLNACRGNLQFGIDEDEHIDCESDAEMVDCLETIDKEFKILKIIKEKGLTLREKEFIKCSENYEEYVWLFCSCTERLYTIQKTLSEYEILREDLKNDQTY